MARRKSKKLKISKDKGRIKRKINIFSFISDNSNTLIIIGLIFLVVVYLAHTNWRIFERRSAIISQIEELKEMTEQLEKRNKELNLGLAQLSDEYYLEKIGREKLGLKKPGEEVVVIIPPPEKEEEVEIKGGQGFWGNLKNSIKNLFRGL